MDAHPPPPDDWGEESDEEPEDHWPEDVGEEIGWPEIDLEPPDPDICWDAGNDPPLHDLSWPDEEEDPLPEEGFEHEPRVSGVLQVWARGCPAPSPT